MERIVAMSFSGGSKTCEAGKNRSGPAYWFSTEEGKKRRGLAVSGKQP